MQQTYTLLEDKQKRNTLVLAVPLILLLATIGSDFLSSRFQKGSFYLSESLLFSTYWLLFLPLLNIQWKVAKQTRSLLFGFILVALAAAIHLLCYPALVWMLSKSFYHHTFPYKQTFDYALTGYFIKTIIIYGLSLPLMTLYKSKFSTQPPATVEEVQAPVHRLSTSIVVPDGNNKKTILATGDILYFSASSPYVNIHHPSKRYLHTETLKFLESQLDSRQFIRIHKSYIVNICKVVSYQSRLNGDYDLTLTDDTILRVSRNYAAVFKATFEKGHRHTTK